MLYSYSIFEKLPKVQVYINLVERLPTKGSQVLNLATPLMQYDNFDGSVRGNFDGFARRDPSNNHRHIRRRTP